MQILKNAISFEWDTGNTNKNFLKHKVSDKECEEVFFDGKKQILNDALHSNNEQRYILLGSTRGKRVLFVVFTARKNKIRVISARDINKKERNLYEKES